MSEQPIAIPWEVHRARMYQDAIGAAAERRLDETEEGGRYLMPDGTLVDADGRVVKGRDRGAAEATRGTHAEMAPAAGGGTTFPDQNEAIDVDAATERAAARERKRG